MKDPKAEFEKTMASLTSGKRGLGTAPPDRNSRFVGTCLRALSSLLTEAARMKAVDVLADVLAWQLAVIGTAGGPGGGTAVVGLVECHLRSMANPDLEEGGGPEPRSH